MTVSKYWSRAAFAQLCVVCKDIIGVVNQLTLQSTVYRSMSSGTARLKRRLDEQGVNYTNKKAIENFCLVRPTGTRGASFEMRVNVHPV